MGDKYDANAVTDTDLEHQMFKIIDKLPSDETYYSIGAEWGHSYKITVGKQSHYKFDWQMSIVRIHRATVRFQLIVRWK